MELDANCLGFRVGPLVVSDGDGGLVVAVKLQWSREGKVDLIPLVLGLCQRVEWKGDEVGRRKTIPEGLRLWHSVKTQLEGTSQLTNGEELPCRWTFELSSLEDFLVDMTHALGAEVQ